MISRDSSLKQLFTEGYLVRAIERDLIKVGRNVCFTVESMLFSLKKCLSFTSASQFISSTKWKCGTFVAMVIVLTMARLNPLRGTIWSSKLLALVETESLPVTGVSEEAESVMFPLWPPKLRMSSFKTLPSLPLPVTTLMSMPRSFARLRTEGVDKAPIRPSVFCFELPRSTFLGLSEDTRRASWASSTASLTRVSPTLHQCI